VTTQSDYPVPVPVLPPGTPPLSDAEALDHLAAVVLGDQDSNNAYVVTEAMVAVLRTGRTVTTYSGV